MFRVGPLVRAVAALLALLAGLAPPAVAVAASARAAQSGTASALPGAVSGTEGADPRTLPGLPTQRAAAGPLVPDPQGVVMDGTANLSTSLTPRLRPAGAAGQLEYEVTTLAGTRVWGATGSDGVRVAEGALRQGGTYLWTARSGAGRTWGPFVMRVDMQRPDAQHLASYGGVTVAVTTGEAAFSFQSDTVESLAGPVGVVLAFRPSNALAAAPAPGLPAGWRLRGGGSYESLRWISTDWVELADTAGRTIPYRHRDSGLWTPVLGADGARFTGPLPSLVQEDSGGFTVTERSGTVTVFPEPGAARAVTRPEAAWSAKEPVVQQRYDAAGRLVALVDPVSGRRAVLVYAGGGDCPAPARGATSLVTAPAGMLCAVTGWDGSRMELLYTGAGTSARIARIVTDAQAGGDRLNQTDIGWDTTGRPTRVRHAPANAGLAGGVLTGYGPANAAAPELLTTLAYDGRGRVASITRPSALVPGRAGAPAQGRRSLAYGPEGTTTVTAPGRTRPVAVVAADPATMLVTRSSDAAGREATATWDTSRQLVTERRLPGGFVERWTYDGLGRVTRKVGPTTRPDDPYAPALDYTYDTRSACLKAAGVRTESARRARLCRRTVQRTLRRPGRTPAGVRRATSTTTSVAVTGPVTEPIRGLQATWWTGQRQEGVPAGHSTGPQMNGAVPSDLSLSWARSPAGGTGAWSGRLQGFLTAPRDGRYTIRADGPSDVWAADQACDPECALDLRAGQPVAVRVDVVSSAAGAASARVTWSGPGVSGPVPTSALRPGYPQPTATSTIDDLGGTTGVRGLESILDLDPSDPARLVAATSPSGAFATRAYEPFDPAAGRFGRALSGTLSPSREVRTSYYAGDEVATAEGCPGAAPAVQGGLGREVALPGGRRVRQVHDAAGRVTARYAGDTLTSCTAYDAAGGVARVWYPPAGDAPAASVETVRTPGNPFRVVTRYAEGGSTAEVEQTTDLLGRVIATRDAYDTVAVTTYDAFDRPVATVTRTAPGETTTSRTTFTEDSLPLTETRDGVVLATYRRDALGRLAGATYANGARLEIAYDGNGAVAERALVVGGARLSERTTVASSGRIVERRIAGPGADARWSYAYDLDGRLTGARLAGTVPGGVAAGEWRYALDDAGRRTSITTPAGTSFATYDASGRITSTTDPAFSAGFAYDARGRATTAGPLSLRYSATGDMTRITDGSATTETLEIAGLLLGRKVTSAPGATPVERRFSLSGLVLDADGLVATQGVTLLGGVSVDLPPPGASGAAGWRYADGLGSTAWTASGSAAPAATTLYDPDGNRLNPGRPDPSGDDPARPDLGWLGLDTAPLAVPVVMMGARSYVPRLGLFLQPDPVPGAGQTDYGYAGADPVNAADPSGGEAEWWAEPLAAVVGVVVAVAITKMTAGAGAAIAGKAFAATGKLTWKAAAAGAFEGLLAGAASDAASQGVLIAGGGQEEYDWRATMNAGLAGAAAGAASGWFSARDELIAAANQSAQRTVSVGLQAGDDVMSVASRRSSLMVSRESSVRSLSVNSVRQGPVRSQSMGQLQRRFVEPGALDMGDFIGSGQLKQNQQYLRQHNPLAKDSEDSFEEFIL